MAYVTGTEKIDLIYTKYTCSHYGTYLLFCMCYSKLVHFTELIMDFCIHDNVVDTIQITDKKLLHFKLSKSGDILCVDKNIFPRLGHIYKSNDSLLALKYTPKLTNSFIIELLIIVHV